MSGVRLSRHYLPGMRRRDWGRIVFISSESGINMSGFLGQLRHAVVSLPLKRGVGHYYL